MPPLRVLIADDSESVCSVLEWMFAAQGFTTWVAHDGQQAVDLARQLQPDLVLLDLMMPRRDGWSAIGELKADPRTTGIPVIALSAISLSDRRIQGAGFNGSLAKPIAGHRLHEEVQRACGLTV